MISTNDKTSIADAVEKSGMEESFYKKMHLIALLLIIKQCCIKKS